MLDAKYWRDRAEDVRIHAGEMRDPIARETMLRIAEEYEKFAQRAGARDGAKPKSPQR
jgi:hypothetical protein